jgi:hypothetical protein
MRFQTVLILAATVLVPSAMLASAMLASVAFAQGGGSVRAACQTDIHALCGSVQPGGGRIRDCMRQHRAELSAGCKIAIADRMLERGGQRANTGTPAAGVTTVPSK